MTKAIIKITDRHIQDGEEFSCELTTSGEFGVTENGGTLDFSYTIDFNNVTASENELLVTVTPKMEE